jgi:hypothetical protein
MGFFSSSEHKITKEEWGDIKQALYGKLDERERAEIEMIFRADLFESGTDAGMTAAEFQAGMEWLRTNTSKHTLEDSDLVLLKEQAAKHLKD